MPDPYHEKGCGCMLYISLFLADEELYPEADLGGEPGHVPLNCKHPHGNECLMAKKQASTLELLPALARKVFIYT